MKEGSIVITNLGKIFKVVEMDFPSKGHARVQRVEENSYDIIEINKTKVETELYSDMADFQFELANGIHRRLNNLNKV